MCNGLCLDCVTNKGVMVHRVAKLYFLQKTHISIFRREKRET